MVLKRVAPVEHFVESEGTLTAARANGTGGGSLTLTFFPAPGEAMAWIDRIDDLLTETPPDAPEDPGLPGQPDVANGDRVVVVAGAGAALFLQRPPVPRPRLSLGPGDLVGIDDDRPELPPQPPPERVRLEVGPRGGAKRELDRFPGMFTVPGGFGSTEPFEADEGSAVGPDDVGNLGRGALVGRGGAAAVAEEQAWECRIVNVSPHDIKVFARVRFIVRRTVTVTRIPLDRLTAVFQGALRGITPVISASDGDLVVGLPQEIADEFGVEAKTIDLEIAEAREASVDIVPVEFSIIRTEAMYRDAFAAVVDALPNLIFDIDEDFVDSMVDAALNGSGVDLLGKATGLVRARPLGGLYNRVDVERAVRGVFDELDIPRRTTGPPSSSVIVRHGNDLALRVKLTADRLRLGAEAAIAAFQILIDHLTASLDLHIGTQRFFSPHPQSMLPVDDPNRIRHDGEFTTSTRLTWTSRFMFSATGLDADVDLGDGFWAGVAEDVVNWAIDTFGWMFEDDFQAEVRSTVRDFLAANSESLAARVRGTLLQIADRGHELHRVLRDRGDLIIEHFGPIASRPVGVRPPLRSHQLTVPIDGAMPADADERLAAIDHIVVVMMENRSFDHMLGWLSHPYQHSGLRRRDIDGLTGAERIPLGGVVEGEPAVPGFDPQLEWRPDPDHSTGATAMQIGDGAMDGFIPSYRKRLAEAPEVIRVQLEDERRIVHGQRATTVPIYEYLAEEFCVLDRWFASFPGPTFVNRMCEKAGLTTSLTNTGLLPDLGYLDALTLFDLLTRSQIPWRLYEGDVSFLRTFDRYRLDFTNIRPQQEFFSGGRDALAPVTFIDPNVTGMPSQEHAEDDHPATDVQWGQLFLQKVLDRLRWSSSWDKTMLIVTYDEHGGFYDHVAPPGTSRFHAANPDVSVDLPRVHPEADTYGVRVPAFVVSPHVAKRSVGHHIYDHTSIIRTVLQRFAPNQIGFMPARVRGSRHLGELLQAEARQDIPPPPRVPSPDPLRVRSNRSRPGLDLSRVRPDPEDARVFLGLLATPGSSE